LKAWPPCEQVMPARRAAVRARAAAGARTAAPPSARRAPFRTPHPRRARAPRTGAAPHALAACAHAAARRRRSVPHMRAAPVCTHRARAAAQAHCAEGHGAWTPGSCAPAGVQWSGDRAAPPLRSVGFLVLLARANEQAPSTMIAGSPASLEPHSFSLAAPAPPHTHEGLASARGVIRQLALATEFLQ
jgi:hypothetical protein